LDTLTELPALKVVDDQEVSGLWLWHGAPPGENERQKAYRPPTRWLSIAGALIVAALSGLAGFVLTLPKPPEPAKPVASSSAPASIDPPPTVPVEAAPKRDPAAEMTRAPDLAAPAMLGRATAPVAVTPPIVSHDRHHQRFGKRTGSALTQLLMTPAFRNGTLRPIEDR
jgi:hypothetical protein